MSNLAKTSFSRSLPLAAGIFASVVCFASANAFAQSASPSLAPLSTVCPGADAALQDSLASAWRRVGFPSTVTVQLRVEGRRVEVTQVSGGMTPYRHAVARAAGRLDCDTQGTGSRTVAFNVRFVGPDALDEPDASTRVASR